MSQEILKPSNTNNSEKYSKYITPNSGGKFADYIDPNNTESLLDNMKTVDQKSDEYAQLEKELENIGVDKKVIFDAIKNVKKPGDVSKNVSVMLESLMIGSGDVIYEEDFDTFDYMKKIVEVIQNSEVLSKEVINECQSQIGTEQINILKTKKYQDLVSHLSLIESNNSNNLYADNIDIDKAIIQLKLEFRKGYDTLVLNLKSQYKKAEIDNCINEIRSILTANQDGINFFKRLEVLSKSELGVTRKFILGMLDLQDARVYFDFNDKKELDNFLAAGLNM
jgi:hypothetical protein